MLENNKKIVKGWINEIDDCVYLIPHTRAYKTNKRCWMDISSKTRDYNLKKIHLKRTYKMDIEKNLLGLEFSKIEIWKKPAEIKELINLLQKNLNFDESWFIKNESKDKSYIRKKTLENKITKDKIYIRGTKEEFFKLFLFKEIEENVNISTKLINYIDFFVIHTNQTKEIITNTIKKYGFSKDNENFLLDNLFNLKKIFILSEIYSKKHFIESLDFIDKFSKPESLQSIKNSKNSINFIIELLIRDKQFYLYSENLKKSIVLRKMFNKKLFDSNSTFLIENQIFDFIKELILTIKSSKIINFYKNHKHKNLKSLFFFIEFNDELERIIKLGNIREIIKILNFGKEYIKTKQVKNNKYIYMENMNLFLNRTASINIEWEIANYIKKKKNHSTNILSIIPDIKIIKGYLAKENLKWDNNQIKAIKMMIENDLVILIGKAGTGKTTVIQILLFILYMQKKIKIGIFTPTGVSANLIREKIGNFKKNNNNLKIIIDTIDSYKRYNTLHDASYDIVIIEETSMIEQKKLYKLINKTKIIKIFFIGDYGQLPSIGVGSILNSFKKTNLLKNKTIELQENYRFKNSNDIKIFANKIRDYKDDNDLDEIINFKSNNVCIEEVDGIETLKTKIFDKKNKLTNKETLIILTSKNNDIYGCNNLNNIIQKDEVLKNNNNFESNLENYSLNSKVMIDTNLYSYGVNSKNIILGNGKIGIIKKIDKYDSKIEFIIEFDNNIEFNNIKYNESFVEFQYNNDCWYKVGKNNKIFLKYILNTKNESSEIPFILSYVSTVHKAQGQEYDEVMLILDSHSYSNITKEHLYTSITRAKKNILILVIIENKKPLKKILSDILENKEIRNNLLSRYIDN